MQIDKDMILALLRERGEGDKANEADRELPSKVDTDEHQGILDRLGLDPQDIIGRLGGSGGLGKGLGGLLGG
jgi:hypothetical protein